MKANGRRHYRTQLQRSGALVVELKYKRREFPAEVIDTSIGGIGICVPRQGAILAATPKETVYLKITASSLREPMVEPGTVQHTRVMGDVLFIGIKFADWESLVERVPFELRTMFNRRLSPRVSVDNARKVDIIARIDEREEALHGVIRDLSADGISFTVEPDVGRRIVQLDHVRVAFEIPSTDCRAAFKARLLHVTEGDAAWRFSAAFEETKRGDGAAMRTELAKSLEKLEHSL